MTVRSHRDLIVWQKSMDLVILVYQVIRRFPADERFRLVDQLARAALSVPANIAEGHARSSHREFAHFLSIAKGSLMETETLLTIGQRLGYGTETEISPVLQLITEISKMVTALRHRIQRKGAADT